MRALANRGLFREDSGRRFSLTPLTEPLRKDAPHSIHPQALWSGSEAYRHSWGNLGDSVRTGRAAFEHAYGKPFFNYLAEQPELARIFDDVFAHNSLAREGRTVRRMLSPMLTVKAGRTSSAK